MLFTLVSFFIVGCLAGSAIMYIGYKVGYRAGWNDGVDYAYGDN